MIISPYGVWTAWFECPLETENCLVGPSAATTDGWDHDAVKREQLNDNMGLVFWEDGSGYHPVWNDTTDRSSAYKRFELSRTPWH
jgi:hypothetical protein